MVGMVNGQLRGVGGGRVGQTRSGRARLAGAREHGGGVGRERGRLSQALGSPELWPTTGRSLFFFFFGK